MIRGNFWQSLTISVSGVYTHLKYSADTSEDTEMSTISEAEETGKSPVSGTQNFK